MTALHPTSDDSVYALAVSPQFSEDGICFAGRSSGLYRSDDGGVTWRGCFERFPSAAQIAVTALALSPDFASDGMVFAGTRGGVLRSTNGGMDWELITLASADTLVIALAPSPTFARDGVILAASLADGVLRSINRGSGWAAWNFGLIDWHTHCLDLSPNFAEDESVVIGTERGAFLSQNGGRSWRPLKLFDEKQPVFSIAFSRQYADDRVIWMGTGRGLIRWSETDGAHLMLNTEESVRFIIPPAAPGDDLRIVLDTALLTGDLRHGDWRRAANLPAVMSALAGINALLIGCVDGQIVRLMVKNENPDWKNG